MNSSNDNLPDHRPNRGYVPWYRRMVPGKRAVVVLIAMLLVGPLGVRCYRLWGLPDVALPFDVEEFSEMPPVKDNAFAYFQQAANQHLIWQGGYRLSDLSHPDAVIGWADIPAELQTWVRQEQSALKLFRQGGRCPTAGYISPGITTQRTILPAVYQLFDMGALATLDALRILDEGRPQDAAETLHDAFRASRHYGRRGCWNERHAGASFHTTIISGWKRWSRDPRVTAEEIETALMRLREDWKLTPPASDGYKVEYLMVVNAAKPPMTVYRDVFDQAVDQAAISKLGLSSQRTTASLNATLPGWQIPVLWIIGEPEISVRAAKLWLVHELPTCDLPPHEQPPRVRGPISVSQTSQRTAGLTAEQLARRLGQAKLLNPVQSGDHILGINRLEAARQTLLETELQLQIHFRRTSLKTRADWEASLVDFPWPPDPQSPERTPIRFRFTDTGLTLWCRGWDGRDYEGQSNDRGDYRDIVTIIPWPGEQP